MVVRVRTLRSLEGAVNTNLLKRQCQGLLRHLLLSQYDLMVTLTDNKTIQKINKRHRGFDKPTDVISIQSTPYRLAPGTPPPRQFGVYDLGELYVSLPYVQHQIEEGKIEEEYLVLQREQERRAYLSAQRRAGKTLNSQANKFQFARSRLHERVLFLCVHGLCHLIGYDHEEEEDWRSMQEKEQDLLAAIRYIPE